MTENKVNNITVLHYDCVDSTNNIAMCLDNAEHLLTVVADSQTGGRGRMGRSFFSYSGGLYVSVVLDPAEIKIPYNICTPAAALAVRGALTEGGVEKICIKWVNDLLLSDRKICGILTESRSENGRIDRIVVGIGINLKAPDSGFPDDIKNKAGSAGYNGDRITLAADIAEKIGKYIKKDQADIVNEYRRNMAWIGERATVTDYSDGYKKIEGTIIGINNDCFLQIRLSDGKEMLLSSGEII